MINPHKNLVLYDRYFTKSSICCPRCCHSSSKHVRVALVCTVDFFNFYVDSEISNVLLTVLCVKHACLFFFGRFGSFLTNTTNHDP